MFEKVLIVISNKENGLVLLNYKSLHTIAHQHHYNFPNISANYYKVIKLKIINTDTSNNSPSKHTFILVYPRFFFCNQSYDCKCNKQVYFQGRHDLLE